MEEITRLPVAVQAPEPGTTALVTGANSGIGFETARLLLDHGVSVWVGARDAERGRRACAALGSGADLLEIDVTDPVSVAAAAERVSELDVLVNNAGVNPGGDDVTGTSLGQLRAAYETNVFGLVAVTQAFLPALRRSGHPRIVNVSSGTGSLAWNSSPNPQFDWEQARGAGLAYRSSKTAVNAVTMLTAQTLGDDVKVNALAPGLRRTNLVRGMSAGGDAAEAALGAVRLAFLPDGGPTGALWSWDGTRVPW
ncbi:MULTISPECIES: SDR family NAD(P)-dependent oxidoreductase [unclassified Curtobacterium]|uniref:SDR family NAD(P)-dependent oxidoreductase n=1 Tax=unclassified Curtobacterium TaxID=257496 RepID=UPI0008DE26F1|nr:MULTISPECIES: SDR family NAD(P)-dependent oxidoreductase [unclassified Curtobacterium]OIH96679.1 short-chain dehydrogenase [Curtobacterium sp. MCBA15_003]OII33301.1 short-chain dehydrogenase [Curtobacterium sp. MMLR14_006]